MCYWSLLANINYGVKEDYILKYVIISLNNLIFTIIGYYLLYVNVLNWYTYTVTSENKIFGFFLTNFNNISFVFNKNYLIVTIVVVTVTR